MTEMNDKSEKLPINWAGFCISLLAAPVATIGSVLVPLLALDLLFDSDEIHGIMAIILGITVSGSVIYLVIGTPTLIWHLHRHDPDVGRIAVLAFKSLIWLIPMVAVFALAMRELEVFYMLIFLAGFGAFLAPLWGAVFARFYKRFTRH